MTISDSLTGRRALVTGGSKGQGAATVARLREAGATVMTTARTMPHDAAHRDLFIAADLSTPGGAQTVLHQVRTRLGALRHPGPRRWRLALTLRRFRSAQRRAVAGRAEPEPAGRSPPRPRTAPGDDRGQVRRRRAHLLHPAAHATVRGNPRLRRRESRTHHLQQRPGQRGRTSWDPRQHDRPRIRTDRRRKRPDRPHLRQPVSAGTPHFSKSWTPSAASRSADRHSPTTPPNSSPSSSPTAPAPSPAPSTSSTAAPCPPPDNPSAHGET